MTKERVVDYFNGDLLAASTWNDKYRMKDNNGNAVEFTPTDMHKRMAKEFARIEYQYKLKDDKNSFPITALSDFGKQLLEKRYCQTEEQIQEEIFNYFDGFRQIVPQGSIMANLGNSFVFGSLSNCFGITPPSDSYAGIMRADQELVQLMKRRGGVGTHLNNLRYSNAPVSNAAKTSSGVPSFAERFSNSTREVAQEGRRGALMLLLSCKHPDIFKFVTMKDDRTKVTGANVSIMFTDEFMFAVENDDDFVCSFPIDIKFPLTMTTELNPGKLTTVFHPATSLDKYNQIYNYPSNEYGNVGLMKIKANELFNLVAEMAHKNAEPGVAFTDIIEDYCPDGVYEIYAPTLCNPCAEQWFSADETCRLIATNLFGFVDDPFSSRPSINFEKIYEVFYMQQRLGDNLVDLEVEYIERIISKIEKEILQQDHNEMNEGLVELRLWQRIKEKADKGRRTGGGFTGLADMLAGLNVQYDCNGSRVIIKEVLKTKMRAELDATIDMSILRGSFDGWNKELEFGWSNPDQKDGAIHIQSHQIGMNSFFDMLLHEFPEQAQRMYLHGRRNVSWSTVAPTGTVSLMTQTTSGLEPLFKAYYIRKRKIVGTEEGARIDSTDAKGDNWQEYTVLHPKFKDWIKIYLLNNIEFKNSMLEGYKLQLRDVDQDLLDELIEWIDKDKMWELFRLSPWFKSEADDINWKSRIEINSIIQKYTTNALSCTINFPKNTSERTIKDTYLYAWKKNLKGVTVYRDGSRDAVLMREHEVHTDKFGYVDSPKRPEELEADYYYITCRGKKYAVVVGKLDNQPYELFAFEDPTCIENIQGKIRKVSKGVYNFTSPNCDISNLQLTSDYQDEKLLTRWVSLLLRHGANPKFIIQQVEKSEVVITSFATVISRVLKNYIPDEDTGKTCPNCKEKTMRYEEGCQRCTSCGFSKC